MSSTASIHTAPPEILIHIFEFLLPKYLSHLMLVCKTWRDTLEGMSHLWTTIDVSDYSIWPKLDVLHKAARNASRAGVLPLTITWNIHLREKELTDDIKAALVDFSRNAPTSRWEHLTLYDCSGFLDDMLDGEFSALKVLQVDLYPTTDSAADRLLQSIERTAVSIEKLIMSDNWTSVLEVMPNVLKRVTSVEITDTDIGVDLPENVVELTTWSLPNRDGVQYVKHLSLHKLELSEGLDFEMMALERLDIGGIPRRSIETGASLRFPNLLLLAMPGNAPFALQSIIAPKLRHLILQEVVSILWEETDELSEDDIVEYYQLVLEANQFPSSIETLTLACYLDEQVISEVLQKVGTLRNLVVEGWGEEGVTQATTVIDVLLDSLANGPSLESIYEMERSERPGPTLIACRLGYNDLPPQIKDDFEKACVEAFALLSTHYRLDRLIITWPDGTKGVMLKEEDTE